MFSGGPIFEGRNEILQLGKSIKFKLIFQKYALKLKIIEKILGKCIFRFCYRFSGGTHKNF